MAESLSLFDDMRRGLVDEGKATLRMRMDHKNENFNMCVGGVSGRGGGL